MRRLLTGSLALFIAACGDQGRPPNTLNTFKVTVTGVFEGSGSLRKPLSVVAPCILKYGSIDAVPVEVKGTKECRYVIPKGEVQIELRAQAVALGGVEITDYNNPVSFRVIPGDISPDPTRRWAQMSNGALETTVFAVHPYGEVHVWVQDTDPLPLFDAGTLVTEGGPPPLVAPYLFRTYASGVSSTLFFADQTLQTLQRPADDDNRSSPFIGEFVQVGKNPSSGEKLQQTCEDDPLRNNADALMVITGLDPGGFYVSDISACRIREPVGSFGDLEPREPCNLTLEDGGLTLNTDGGMGVCSISQKTCRRVNDCNGYLPGTFAGMFVYNYNFPDGLDEGDLLFTLSGSIQEFTSTTQMVFPAWTTAERVRQLPQEQWNKWLQYARPYDVSLRTCGSFNQERPYITDAMCGQNRRNMKMESLESSLVRIRHVRFPKVFKTCDLDGDGTVTNFCEHTQGVIEWGSCNFDNPAGDSPNNVAEYTCAADCIVGRGEFANTLCAERTNFVGFGQYAVEMRLPGPGRYGLDDALGSKVKSVLSIIDAGVVDAGVRDAGIDAGVDAGMPDAGDSDAGEPDGGDLDAGQIDAGFDAGVIDAGPPPVINPAKRIDGYNVGEEISFVCDGPANYAFSGAPRLATESDERVEAGVVIRHQLATNETGVTFRPVTGANSVTCSTGLNQHTKINIITRDAVPDLSPDCSETDANVDAATQCKALHAAEFDIIGHMKQVQAARPRWVVIPRAADDLCCYPGPGMSCPAPIQPCQPNQ